VLILNICFHIVDLRYSSFFVSLFTLTMVDVLFFHTAITTLESYNLYV